MTGPVTLGTNTSDHFLKREEAAQVLKVSLRQLDELLAKGIIPYLKLGGAVRICLDDLKQLPRRRRAAEESPYVTK